MSKDFKELSKYNYGLSDNQTGPTNEQIQIGCMQRIADATEKMAVSYDSIMKAKNAAENERDKYYRWYKEEKAAKESIQRSNSSLRGVITRMKNKQESEK